MHGEIYVIRALRNSAWIDVDGVDVDDSDFLKPDEVRATELDTKVVHINPVED